MPKVFISYSRADITQVLAFDAALRQTGLDTWLDFKSLRPGERWKEAIDAAISSADAFLLCLSPMSVESAWTSIELKLALEKNVKVIPVIFRQVSLETLPLQFREIQVLEMEHWPLNDASTYAARAIATALGMESIASSEADDLGSFETIWVSIGERALSPSKLAMSTLRVDADRIKYWHASAVTDSMISEVLASAVGARRAVIVVTGNADCFEAHVLIGAVAARVGEWRLTLVEYRTDRAFEKCAALCRAHYTCVDSHDWSQDS